LILAATWVDHPWPLEVLESRAQGLVSDGAEIQSGTLRWQWRWLMNTCINIAVSPGDAQVRAEALDVLAWLMTSPDWEGLAESNGIERMRSAIRKALTDEHAAVRVEALKRLDRFVGAGEWQRLITMSIRDPDRSVKLAALVEAAGWYLRAPELSIVEAVGEQLQHDDALVREAAAGVFTGTQFDGWDVPYVVFKQLVLRAEHDGDERVRAKAVEALWRLKRRSSSAVACLIRCSKDSSALVRQQAIYSLRTKTESTEAVRSAIRDALRDQDESVRAEAMAAANELGYWPDELIPILLAGLADPSAAVRSNAISQLARDPVSFSEFHPWMETIRDLTASEDRGVRNTADGLLNHIMWYDPPLRD
jgi:HEAT repeat protein